MNICVCVNVHGQVDAETGEQLTGNLALNRSIKLAKWLHEEGVTIGDVVSISSHNCLEFCLVPIAVFFIGATIAPLNCDYTTGTYDNVKRC